VIAVVLTAAFYFSKLALRLFFAKNENYLTLYRQENGSNLSAEVYMGRGGGSVQRRKAGNNCFIRDLLPRNVEMACKTACHSLQYPSSFNCERLSGVT
jgi:hypothetical protein